MSAESFKRKLTAILSADVKGYSRLMGEDEAETVKTITAYRKIMGELIHQHRGRVIDSPGDNILAEFGSVVDAVQCAVAAQNEFKARNADLPENRRMEFRIGVNLGDVIEEEGRIYGDGVNIAARLEGCADPGGICVSKTAFDQIETKLPLGYEYLGEQTVKNITKPVGAYRVLMEPRVTVAGVKEKKPTITLWRRKSVLAGAVAVLILIIGAGVWNFHFRTPTIEPASLDKMAHPLPDKPSIAVLPFDNLSDDTEQEYFSDGLTEEIITALSKTDQLFVIARNSTFTYKGKPVKVQQVAEDLGIRYVLEGSVRKDAERVRITAQLVDAIEGIHLWAERYDRDLRDIFAIQDEITMKIISALQVELTDGELASIAAKTTDNLQAYLKFTQARKPFYTMTKEGIAQARRLCEEAIALDPEYAQAYLLIGGSHWMDILLGASKAPKESLKRAFEFVGKAQALDDSLPEAHAQLGWLYIMTRQHDKGIAECERAINLAPNSANAHIWMGLGLKYAGRHEEAVRYSERALRLDPHPPQWFFRAMGSAYSHVGRYREAIAFIEKALQGAPNDLLSHVQLTVAYSWAGRLEEAREQAGEVLTINPKYSIENAATALQYAKEADHERFLNALRKAGIPEHPSLPLPDKPSIAVLPLVNMSDDKSQEYFSDGLTEEIITALSKTPKLFVIARNSSFVYKGKPVNVQQVSRELGVKYVLEGSVRRSGEQLRITAQLIDATTGNHLWAERWDREVKDIFVIQDEITMKIASALQVKLTEGEWASILAKATESLEAYLKILEGRELINALNRNDNALARKKFEEAIALDPKSAVAYAYLGSTYVMDFALGVDREESMKKAFTYTQKALSLDDSQPVVYTTMEFMYGFMRRHEEAIASAEKAVRSAPGSAYAQFSLGRALNFACRDREALMYLEMAVRMNPIPPGTYYMHIGSAHLNLRNYEEAVSALKKALAIAPKNEFARSCLIVAYVEMDRMEEARTEAQEYRKTIPSAKPTQPEEFKKRAPWKDEKVTERFIEAFLKVRS
jgi:adenylate cyclase